MNHDNEQETITGIINNDNKKPAKIQNIETTIEEFLEYLDLKQNDKKEIVQFYIGLLTAAYGRDNFLERLVKYEERINTIEGTEELLNEYLANYYGLREETRLRRMIGTTYIPMFFIDDNKQINQEQQQEIERLKEELALTKIGFYEERIKHKIDNLYRDQPNKYEMLQEAMDFIMLKSEIKGIHYSFKDETFPF
ncbi:MAG: hypothetical protein ACMXYG_04155 [Candidatus Woesearchaeota archaeon]